MRVPIRIPIAAAFTRRALSAVGSAGAASGRGGFVVRSSLALVALAMTSAVLAGPAHAAGVVGTGTAASCTESALDRALAGGGLVTFDCGGVAAITVTGTKTITVDTTIDGGGGVTAIDGGGGIELSGGGAVRVLRVEPGAHLTLERLRVDHGKADAGGAIYNSGDLTIRSECRFRGNTARQGGAIFNASGGNLDISGFAQFQGNNASGVDDPTASKWGIGGAIDNQGNAKITDATFLENHSTHVAGAVASDRPGRMNIKGGEFSNNSAGYQGGAVWNGSGLGSSDNYSFGMWMDGVYLVGNKTTGDGIGGAIDNDGGIEITHTRINGNSSGSGGGVASFGYAFFGGDTVTQNKATKGAGGGIAFGDYHTLGEVTSSTVSSNEASASGGGIETGEAEADIERSTIFGNTAHGRGGGIDQSNGVTAGRYGTLVINASTVGGNVAAKSGGGIYKEGNLRLLFSTIVDNEAPVGSQLTLACGRCGLLEHLPLPRFAFEATIFGHVSHPETHPNCSGSYSAGAGDLGYSITDDRTCAVRRVKLLKLFDIASNGGLTRTYLPMTDSPAVDAAGTCRATTDQRGLRRPASGACDVGAVELQDDERKG